MAYRSILTVATGTGELSAMLRTASALTRANDGHLEVLAVGVDALRPAVYGITDSMVALQITQDQARDAAGATEVAARDCLMQESPVLRWSLESAAVQTYGLRELVAQHARFSDLVVLGHPYGAGTPKEAETVLEVALFDAEAPVLVVPQGGGGAADIGRRIVVAWNQSREAMSAVRCALPMLVAADEVNIVVVNPPVQGAERSDPGGLLCQMLVRHGVRCQVSVLARTEPRVFEVVLRHLRDCGADLLVMGAYGHSRLREAILGGATRDLLEQCPIPMLMAH